MANQVRSFVLFFAMVLLPLAWLTPAAAGDERRVALVIGMSKYEQVATLANPVSDAGALSEALSKLNFDVTNAFDLGKRDLEKTLRNFGTKAANADVIMIFYAGHGVQVDGQNYMIPVDAHLEHIDDLPYEAVPLGLFLRAIRNAGSAGVMIVDACRNNPFTEKLSKDGNAAVKIGIGLGRVDDTPSGTLLAMATRANTVALDGIGRHSPYSTAILEELATPGVELHLFFGRVADRVKSLTNSRQEPYISGTLGGKSVYLNPKPANYLPESPRQNGIKVTNSAVALPLGLLRPTDKDPDDKLTIEIIAIPAGGLIRAGDRILDAGSVLPAADIEMAVFTGDAAFTGEAGSLRYRVTDLNGGSVEVSIPFTVAAGNRPPAVSEPSRYVAARNWLGISLPIDPDGDALTVTVIAVPQAGRILDGRIAIAKGQKLEPEALTRLIYEAGDAPAGPVGNFLYRVDDGKGGEVISSVEIEVGGAGAAGLILQPKPVAIETPAPPPPKAEAKAPALKEEPPAISTSGAGTADCGGCPTMVEIPAGSFEMGRDDGRRNERPVHKVTVPSFAVSEAEITVEQWRACAEAGNCAASPGSNRDDPLSPVTNISWDDSLAYVAWLSARTGKRYRLLTEAEWEYAARAGAIRGLQLGETANGSAETCAECGNQKAGSARTMVRNTGSAPRGIAGVGGGVAEWVMDCWKPSYDGAPNDGSARLGGCSLRALRGGTGDGSELHNAVTVRGFAEHVVKRPDVGLRIARDSGG